MIVFVQPHQVFFLIFLLECLIISALIPLVPAALPFKID